MRRSLSGRERLPFEIHDEEVLAGEEHLPQVEIAVDRMRLALSLRPGWPGIGRYLAFAGEHSGLGILPIASGNSDAAPRSSCRKPARLAAHGLVERALVELRERFGREVGILRDEARARCISAVRLPSSLTDSRYAPIISLHRSAAAPSAPGLPYGSAGMAPARCCGRGRSRDRGPERPACTPRHRLGWEQSRGGWPGHGFFPAAPVLDAAHRGRVVNGVSVRNRPISRSGFTPSLDSPEQLQHERFAEDHGVLLCSARMVRGRLPWRCSTSVAE